MGDNPYQSPLAESLEAFEPAGIRIDGKYVVVQPGAVFPPFCVRTGVPVRPQDMRKALFSWIPPGKCTFTYGLSPDVRRRLLIQRGLLIPFAILLILAFPVVAWLDGPFLLLWIIVAASAAVAAWLTADPRLRVTKYRNGEFWIWGCGQQFLARVAAQPRASGAAGRSDSGDG